VGNWFDFLAVFDVIDRIEGIVSSFLYADWRNAYRRAGVAGVSGELARTFVGANRRKFWVPRDAGWSGVDIERFLRKYGVAIWDRGFVGNDYFFCVKERQANWAEYLLLRRGVPISGPLFNPDNAAHGERYAPGDAPPAWVDRGQRPEDPIDKIAKWL
jgi:hypothetical protein